MLHYGQFCIPADPPDLPSAGRLALAAAWGRFCRRDPRTLKLQPLADPYDHYARAVLLHAGVRTLPPGLERDICLHEARDALLSALHGVEEGPGKQSTSKLHYRQQFNHARAFNSKSGEAEPRSRGECAATDPRLWYLLGLVLCDLGSYAEAQKVYRQVLRSLPMAYFGHVVHFNLACIQAAQTGETTTINKPSKQTTQQTHQKQYMNNIIDRQQKGCADRRGLESGRTARAQGSPME